MNVPKRPERRHYPFAEMEVNDGEPLIIECVSKEAAKLARCAAHSHGYRTGWKFVTVLEDNVLYVWRVE